MSLIQKLVRKLGAYSNRKQGEEFVFTCPQPGCHKQKLEVNPRKRIFHCWRCGYSGSVVALVGNESLTERNGAALLLPLERTGAMLKLEFNFENNLTRSMVKFLIGRGIDASQGSRFYSSGEKNLRGRLIIPITEGGVTVSYIARAVNGEEPKEISGPNRSQYLYGLDEITSQDGVILVEGVFDYFALRRASLPAVAVMGCHISAVQIGKLLSRNPKWIAILFDGDTAGIEGGQAARKELTRRTHIPVQRIELPEGQDPDDLTPQELQALLLGNLDSIF